MLPLIFTDISKIKTISIPLCLKTTLKHLFVYLKQLKSIGQNLDASVVNQKKKKNYDY